VTAVVVALGLLVVGLLQSHAQILRALHGLGVDLSPSGSDALPRPVAGPLGAGATVPASVSGLDPMGGAVSVALVGEGRLTLLGFLSSGCLTCRPMWDAMGADEAAIPGGARPVAVTKGPHEESPASVRSLASSQLTTIMSSEAWATFAVPGSPYFVLVDGEETAYPDYVVQATRLLRPGGVMVVDHMLWRDHVADPAARDEVTRTLRDLGKALRDDTRFATTLLPVGDGLLVAVKR